MNKTQSLLLIAKAVDQPARTLNFGKGELESSSLEGRFGEGERLFSSIRDFSVFWF